MRPQSLSATELFANVESDSASFDVLPERKGPPAPRKASAAGTKNRSDKYQVSKGIWAKSELIDDLPNTSDKCPFSIREKIGRIYKDMSKEASRLQSFENFWFPQITQRPIDLAKQGFYYIGPGDKVKAICCDLELSHWANHHDIKARHALHSRNCPGFTSIEDFYNGKNFHKEYSSEMNDYHRRLATFVNHWPSVYEQKPDEMAKDGFYYYGPSDTVKCYYCGIEINTWFRGEAVEPTHYQWSKGQCAYNSNNMKIRQQTKKMHDECCL